MSTRKSGAERAGSVFYNRQRDLWVAQVPVRDEAGRATGRKTRSAPTREEAERYLEVLRAEYAVLPFRAHKPASHQHGDGSVFYDKSRSRWVGTLDVSAPGEPRRRRKVSAPTEAGARDALSRLRRSVALAPHAPGRLTVAGLADLWLARKLPTKALAGSTLSSYRNAVNVHIGPSPLGAMTADTVTPSDVETWLAEFEEAGLSRSTRQTARCVLGQMYGWGEREGLVPANVVRLADPVRSRAGRRTRKPRRMLTAEEAGRLMTIAERDGWRALVLVMLGLGLRRGEALGLRWTDLDLQAGTLHLSGAIASDVDGGELYSATKTGEESVKLLPPELVDALREQRTRQARAELAYPGQWPAGGWVFTDEDGHRIKRARVTTAVTRMAQEAGLGHVTPHMLRHSAVSILRAAGVPLHVVSRVVDHSALAMTELYTHLTAGDREAARDAMEAYLKGTRSVSDLDA